MRSVPKVTALLIAGLELALLLMGVTLFYIIRSHHPGPSGLMLALAPLVALPVLMIAVPQSIVVASRRSDRNPSRSCTLNLVAESPRPRSGLDLLKPLDLPKPPSLRQQLQNIDWFQFEKLVHLTIEKRGHSVSRRGGANPDGGIDLLIQDNGQLKAVQCKHWKTWRVGVKQLREFLGALTAERIPKGVFVTLGKFTRPARHFAQQHPIQLVNGDGLLDLLVSLDAEKDPDFQAILTSTTKTCPRCESPMVFRTQSREGGPLLNPFWGCSRFPECRGKLKA